MDRRAERYRKQHLRRRVLILLALVIAVAIAFGVLWSGALAKGVLKPGKVRNVTAEATYSGIALTWDEGRRANGYVIYEDEDGTYVKVDKVKGKESCEYTVKGAEPGQEHTYCVAAYNYSRLSNRNFEGEPSDEVTAYYDEAKYAQKIPILTYHQVMKKGETAQSGLLIGEDVLEEHLKYLHDNGFKTLTPDEFYQWYKGEKEFPKKTVMITFDDGYDNTYYLGYPLIRKYDMAATVFLIGKNIGDTTTPFEGRDEEKSYYVGWDVIQKVREEYPRFSFESHTYDMHSRVDGEKPANVFTYDQIMEDCKKNEKFGFNYLAYPWGTYSDAMQKAVKDSGFKLAFAYRPFYYATRQDDPYAINRIKISGKISMEDFIDIVNQDKEKYDNPDLK